MGYTVLSENKTIYLPNIDNEYTLPVYIGCVDNNTKLIYEVNKLSASDRHLIYDSSWWILFATTYNDNYCSNIIVEYNQNKGINDREIIIKLKNFPYTVTLKQIHTTDTKEITVTFNVSVTFVDNTASYYLHAGYFYGFSDDVVKNESNRNTYVLKTTDTWATINVYIRSSRDTTSTTCYCFYDDPEYTGVDTVLFDGMNESGIYYQYSNMSSSVKVSGIRYNYATFRWDVDGDFIRCNAESDNTYTVNLPLFVNYECYYSN